MATTRGGYQARDFSLDKYEIRGRVVGAGAADPTVPSDKDNSMVTSALRNGVGDYTLTFKAAVKPWNKTLRVGAPCVVSTGATQLVANVIALDAAAGTIRIQCRNASTGAAAEAANTDTIYVSIDVRYSDA
jgi:hypothetical protein